MLMLSVALLVTPPEVAEIVAEVFRETELVTTGKVAELAPAATVTVAGTLAMEGLLLARLTVRPPEGASPLRVTVPVEGLPPVTLVGASVKVERLGALIVTSVVLVTPEYEAEIVALVGKDTADELT